MRFMSLVLSSMRCQHRHLPMARLAIAMERIITPAGVESNHGWDQASAMNPLAAAQRCWGFLPWHVLVCEDSLSSS